jgi:hypothetical protein
MSLGAVRSRPRTVLFAALAALVAWCVLVPASPAFAGLSDDVFEANDKAVAVYNAFIETDAPTAAQTAATAEEIRGYASDVHEVASKASDTEAGALTDAIGSGLEALADGVGALGGALESGDDDAILAAAEQCDAAVDGLIAAATAFDDYMAEHPAAAGDTMWFVWTGL